MKSIPIGLRTKTANRSLTKNQCRIFITLRPWRNNFDRYYFDSLSGHGGAGDVEVLDQGMPRARLPRQRDRSGRRHKNTVHDNNPQSLGPLEILRQMPRRRSDRKRRDSGRRTNLFNTGKGKDHENHLANNECRALQRNGHCRNGR